MNESDNEAASKVSDSLINFENVKVGFYFIYFFP